MKTFKQLSVGDKLYFTNNDTRLLDTKDQYGNVYKAEIFNSVVIQTLSLGDSGQVLVNRSKGSYNDNYLLIVPVESQGLTTMAFDKRIFFTTEEEMNASLKGTILKRIRENEASIISHKNKMLFENRQLRAKYWNALNPSHNLVEIESPELLEAVNND